MLSSATASSVSRCVRFRLRPLSCGDVGVAQDQAAVGRWRVANDQHAPGGGDVFELMRLSRAHANEARLRVQLDVAGPVVAALRVEPVELDDRRAWPAQRGRIAAQRSKRAIARD